MIMLYRWAIVFLMTMATTAQAQKESDATAAQELSNEAGTRALMEIENAESLVESLDQAVTRALLSKVLALSAGFDGNDPDFASANSLLNQALLRQTNAKNNLEEAIIHYETGRPGTPGTPGTPALLSYLDHDSIAEAAYETGDWFIAADEYESARIRGNSARISAEYAVSNCSGTEFYDGGITKANAAADLFDSLTEPEGY